MCCYVSKVITEYSNILYLLFVSNHYKFKVIDLAVVVQSFQYKPLVYIYNTFDRRRLAVCNRNVSFHRPGLNPQPPSYPLYFIGDIGVACDDVDK